MARSTPRRYPGACLLSLQVGNVHTLLIYPDSKHPSCVRGRVPFRPTEFASVRCHSSSHCTMKPPMNYNIDCRRSSQVGSYRPGIRPSSVHGLLTCPDSKHPSCVRGRVSFRPTECASVRCHSRGHCMVEPPTNYNKDYRRSSQVDSYRQGRTSLSLDVGNVHGLLTCPDSKHPSCVGGHVPFRPTECASVRCHSSGHYIMEPPTNYNIDGRRSSQMGSYRSDIRPFELLAVKLGRQLPIGILGRIVDRNAQRKLSRSP